MALHDYQSLVLFAGDASPSLPDPASVPASRVHDLVNPGASAAVWTATGTNPFLVDGAAVASLTVPPGGTARVQPVSGKWVLVRPYGTRRLVAATGVSAANGDVTFTFTPPFPSVPVVAQAVQTANTNTTEARVTALSASSCTINVRGSAVLVVLGINVLGAPAPLAGATVHLLATEAG